MSLGQIVGLVVTFIFIPGWVLSVLFILYGIIKFFRNKQDLPKRKSAKKKILLSLIAFLFFSYIFLYFTGFFHFLFYESLYIPKDLYRKFVLKEIEVTDINLSCINAFGLGDNDFVINSDKEYYPLISHKESYLESCKNFQLPPIDFTKYTLLGFYSSGGGCKASKFTNNAYIDNSGKKVIYVSKIVDYGSCLMLTVSMNWGLVPKIPPGYNVVFESEHRTF